MIWLILGYALAAVWGGFWWRARGGGLADVLHNRLGGTNATRAFCSIGMIAPLLLFGWHALLLIPAEFVGWAIAGWGSFQDMGADNNNERPNPVAQLFGKLMPLPHDLAGMAVEGLICMSPSALVLGWLHGFVTGLVVFFSGLAFSPLYLVGNRLRFPSLGLFCEGVAWREALVGAWVFCVLLTAVA